MRNKKEIHLGSFPSARDFFLFLILCAHSSAESSTFYIDIKNTYEPSK